MLRLAQVSVMQMPAANDVVSASSTFQASHHPDCHKLRVCAPYKLGKGRGSICFQDTVTVALVL